MAIQYDVFEETQDLLEDRVEDTASGIICIEPLNDPEAEHIEVGEKENEQVWSTQHYYVPDEPGVAAQLVLEQRVFQNIVVEFVEKEIDHLDGG